MTPTEKALQYARDHPQEVALVWIDGSRRMYSADRAAQLCAMPRVAACLMEAQAEDKQLAAMLNQVIDSAE